MSPPTLTPERIAELNERPWLVTTYEVTALLSAASRLAEVMERFEALRMRWIWLSANEQWRCVTCGGDWEPPQTPEHHAHDCPARPLPEPDR